MFLNARQAGSLKQRSLKFRILEGQTRELAFK